MENKISLAQLHCGWAPPGTNVIVHLGGGVWQAAVIVAAKGKKYEVKMGDGNNLKIGFQQSKLA